MHLTVDGILYQWQQRGGVLRLFDEILPRMCDMDATLQVNLVTEKDHLRQPVPRHPRIRHRVIPRVERYLRPWRLWRPCLPAASRWMRRRTYGSGHGQIWHSTYFTLPDRWRGKQVVTVHDMVHERFRHLFNYPDDDQFREQKRRCVLAADSVICVSASTCRDVLDLCGIAGDKIHVIPNAANECFRVLTETGPVRPPTSEKPFLLYVGDRPHYKNVGVLYEAYARWPGHNHVDLVLVSRQSWSAAEQQYLDRLKIASHVQLFTSVEDEELAGLYNRAVALVHPSLYEGFGIPLLEAMACGCPVVASRIPSTIEVAGECPIYFEADAPDSLVAALEQVAREGGDSPRRQRGLDRAKQYSWDQTARQTLEVYREVTA